MHTNMLAEFSTTHSLSPSLLPSDRPEEMRLTSAVDRVLEVSMETFDGRASVQLDRVTEDEGDVDVAMETCGHQTP